MPAPVVAVVGRPNVGKSTLVNRILGSRQAVVEDTPGVTRDRVAYDATWRGRAFTLVDTGGWEPAVEGSEALAARVAAQARVAVDAADAVLFVVDAVVGVTDADAAVAAVLRRSRKPVVLAANKVDDGPAEAAATSLWSLGLGEPCPVSALHGRGSGDLLDADARRAPGDSPGALRRDRRPAPGGAHRPPERGQVQPAEQAGRRSERVLVDAVAGTTRDPVDELIELGGSVWRFVDTAGIRRRVRETQGADYFAALRTERALERAEVAVVLVDASEPLAEQDLRIVSMVIEAGRALVIAYNKWDLVDEDRRHFLNKEIDRQLHTARWAPRVNISAATGWHTDRLVPALARALDGWETRVPTGRLNAWLAALVAATPPPVRGGKQPKILFATQAGIRPPALRPVHVGFPAGRLPEVRRAQAPGGVRLRGQPGARDDAAAGEAGGRQPGPPVRPYQALLGAPLPGAPLPGRAQPEPNRGPGLVANVAPLPGQGPRRADLVRAQAGPGCPNSPSPAPPRNASHSDRVNISAGPSPCLELRRATSPPVRNATSTQLSPVDPPRRLLIQLTAASSAAGMPLRMLLTGIPPYPRAFSHDVRPVPNLRAPYDLRRCLRLISARLSCSAGASCFARGRFATIKIRQDRFRRKRDHALQVTR